MKTIAWFMEKEIGCERVKNFESFKDLKDYYKENGIPAGFAYGFDAVTKDRYTGKEVVVSARYQESALR